MIKEIHYAGQREAVKSRLVNSQQAVENTGKEPSEVKADFSKLLFDAFREQNRSFTADAGNASSKIAASGGTNVGAVWGKSGVPVNNEEMNRIFKMASQKYQVPEALLKAVAKAESNFNPHAVSSAGAMGVMQLMPETADFLGVSDPFNAEENIMGGARYLSDKLAMYDGNVELALAAYNAGSGNVKKYGGVPPFAETQNYIKKVLAYMEMDHG